MEKSIEPAFIVQQKSILMKQKKKLWLIVAALLLMLSFLFSRISVSTDGIDGWVLLGIGGLFFILALLLIVVRGSK